MKSDKLHELLFVFEMECKTGRQTLESSRVILTVWLQSHEGRTRGYLEPKRE